MNIETYATVLLAIAPAVAAIITVIGGFLSLIKSIKAIKNDNNETVKKSVAKLEQVEKKLNTINSKLATVEQYLLEEQEKRR